MTDFIRWLYAHYIKPQIDASDATGYETSLSLMENTLEPDMRIQYERALEFHSGSAFLLGLRTGAGLACSLDVQSSHASFGSHHPSI